MVSTLIATALMTAAGNVIADLGEGIQTLSWPWRISGLAVLIAVTVANVTQLFRATTVASVLKSLVPALAGLVVFVTLVSWDADGGIAPVLAMTFATLVLLLAQELMAGAQLRRLAERVEQDADWGFATTGVLINTSNAAEPHFVLVFNRNLQGGKGLFVPPGGHFRPSVEHPVETLVAKILSEVGMVARLWPYLVMMPDEAYQITEGARWIAAPAFILTEDMYGRCSHGHLQHHDYVYVCETDGTPVSGLSPKYDRDQRLEIRLRECAPGFERAKAALEAAVEQWHRRIKGVTPALRQQVTDDVVWRLHLTAKQYMEVNRDA